KTPRSLGFGSDGWPGIDVETLTAPDYPGPPAKFRSTRSHQSIIWSRRARRRSLQSAPMRVAVVDIGTNSTRLLVANVEHGRVETIERRTTVTRLGEDVDRTGRLREPAVERVLSVCADYSQVIEALAVESTVAVLTSAVRDAANGPGVQTMLRERFGFQAETIPGE